MNKPFCACFPRALAGAKGLGWAAEPWLGALAEPSPSGGRGTMAGENGKAEQKQPEDKDRQTPGGRDEECGGQKGRRKGRGYRDEENTQV